jgi:hypothetical protein
MKWFYVKVEATADHKYGLAPFDSTTKVEKPKTSDLP